MTDKTMQDRGIEAAMRHVQRLGWELTADETIVPGAFYAVDAGQLVLVRVHTGHNAKQTVPAIGSRYIKAIANRRDARIDHIGIIVIGEDKALLRHHRAVYAPSAADQHGEEVAS